MSLLAALAASALLAAPAPAARPADHVFIVMLDGTRPDFLRRADAPVIHALAAAGTTWPERYTFSPALRVGNLLFLSGTTAVDDSGTLVAPGLGTVLSATRRPMPVSSAR